MMVKINDGIIESDIYIAFYLAILKVYFALQGDDVPAFYDSEFSLLELCCQYILRWDYIPRRFRKEIRICGSKR